MFSPSSTALLLRSLRRAVPVMIVLFLMAESVPSLARTETISAASIAALGPHSYMNYSSVEYALSQLEAAHPDICAVHDIGDGWQKTQGLADRDILAMKISDNVSSEEEEPSVLILGLMHAREWPTAEVAVNLATALTSGYGTNPRISWLVDHREIWIVPVVNPDGLDYALSVDPGWRKNMRDNGDGTFGVDLNRNFAGSCNGDPAGAWGGAGASHDSSQETFCGSSAFSEPETQAIRDLVQAHNFSLAIDFHTYGRWVMWPWGYTNESAPDAAELRDLGLEFGALSGFYASQSYEMYYTTGDSADWMYGSAGIYSYCIELGGQFHPQEQADVDAIISDGLALGLHGIEAAGATEEAGIVVNRTQPITEPYSTSGFDIQADITATAGVNTSSPMLVYKVNGGQTSSVKMTLSQGNDTFSATIPRQGVSTLVEYYIQASDLAGRTVTAPAYAPYELYTFTVAPSDEDPAAIVTHEPRSESSLGNTVFVESGIEIRASVLDPQGVAHVRLHYCPGRAYPYYILDMNSTDGSLFTAVIPSAFDAGVDYWIDALDDAGQTTYLPSTAPSDEFRSWNSPPTIVEHNIPEKLNAGSVLRLEVQAKDDYGIRTFDVRVHRGDASSGFKMSLTEGNSSAGTWICELQFVQTGNYIIELVEFDGRAWSWTNVSLQVVRAPEPFPSYIVPGLAVGGIVIVVLVAMRVSRARRS